MASRADKQHTFYLAVRRGCPRRTLDAARLFRYLELNGWSSVADPRAARLAIIWTCGGFDHTEVRSLRTIRQAIRKDGRKRRVIVTGCLIKINPEALAGLPAEQLSPGRLADLDAIIDASVPFDSVPETGIIPDVSDLVQEPAWVRIKRQLQPVAGVGGRIWRCLCHRVARIARVQTEVPIIRPEAYNLLVARGCVSNCSYCAIRISMGRVRSRPLAEIRKQFEGALAEGHKLFALIAEDVGAYGRDIGLTVCDLLEALFAVGGDFKLIINDLNAQWLVRYGDDLVDILARHQDKIDSLVLPIQSGSDRVLRLMKRGYKIDRVKEVLGNLRRQAPDLRVCTHIIVGFPTETEEDFQASRGLVETMGFRHVDVYAYEERAMTASSKIFPKTPSDVIVARARNLAASLETCGRETRGS